MVPEGDLWLVRGSNSSGGGVESAFVQAVKSAGVST